MTTSIEIYERLRKDIIFGRYAPMHFFDIRQISSEYLISAVPVREAMLRLSERGLLRWEKNRGFLVQKIDNTTAVFYFSQIRSSYLYAINRITGKSRKFIFEDRADIINHAQTLESYIKWVELISKEVFSSDEAEYVKMIWDRIWIYRNNYLNDPWKGRRWSLLI